MAQPPSHEKIATWIDRHVAKGPMLPCRVDEMSPREYEIFKVASYYLGFLQYLRTRLPRVPHEQDDGCPQNGGELESLLPEIDMLRAEGREQGD